MTRGCASSGMFGKSDPFLVIKRRMPDGSLVELARTEVRSPPRLARKASRPGAVCAAQQERISKGSPNERSVA